MEQDHIRLLKKDYSAGFCILLKALPLQPHALQLLLLHNQNMTDSKDTSLFSMAISTFYKV